MPRVIRSEARTNIPQLILATAYLFVLIFIPYTKATAMALVKYNSMGGIALGGGWIFLVPILLAAVNIPFAFSALNQYSLYSGLVNGGTLLVFGICNDALASMYGDIFEKAIRLIANWAQLTVLDITYTVSYAFYIGLALMAGYCLLSKLQPRVTTKVVPAPWDRNRGGPSRPW